MRKHKKKCTQDNDHLQSFILSHICPSPLLCAPDLGERGGEGEGSSLWPMKVVRQKKLMPIWWKEIGISGTRKTGKVTKGGMEADYDRGQSTIGRWAVGN
jgi:hypothetical protein